MTVKLELFSFDFAPTKTIETIPCPNCGFLLHRVSDSALTLTRSFTILGCGTLLYLNYFKKDQLRSKLLDIQNIIQYYGKSILALLSQGGSNYNDEAETRRPEKSQICESRSHQTPCFYNTQFNDQPIDYNLPITLPSFNSFDSLSTVTTFDYQFDQVHRQIKEYIEDSNSQFNSFQSPNCSVLERHYSESEITLPSLEWDLGDTPLYQESIKKSNDDFHHFGGKKQSFLYNVKYNGIIDTEVLSQIIFNKDFEFKNTIYDPINLKKHLATLRHKLTISSNISYRKYSPNPDLTTFKSNRDSAFFEEEI